MQACLNVFGRVVAGPLLILLGFAMLVGLAVFSALPAEDVYAVVAAFLCVQAYSIVAVLFVLVGLRYVLGPRSWIDGLAEASVGRVAGVAVLGGLGVGVLWLVAVL